MCSRCDSAIPFNADACVVCETPALASTPAPLPPPVHILCPKCKSANPSNARTCAMCQSQLFLVTHPVKIFRCSIGSAHRFRLSSRHNEPRSPFHSIRRIAVPNVNVKTKRKHASAIGVEQRVPHHRFRSRAPNVKRRTCQQRSFVIRAAV